MSSAWPETAGLNLVGYASAPLGLGAELRQMAEAFLEHNYPFSIIDIRLVDSTRVPAHLRPHMVTQARYPTSLFCMSPFGYIDIMARCEADYRDQYKIGSFFWELPDLPAKCQTIFDTIDELWAATRFLKDVFTKAGPRPVIEMPTPGATVPACEGDLRERLGIPADTFVFGFMFDAQSSLHRKNPQAVVQAFIEMRRLLPPEQKTALLLKVHRLNQHNLPEFSALKRQAEGVEGVHFMTTSLPHRQLGRYFNTLDAYVSLHRSEGLGRTLIEAAQRGLPVLCTEYSGSADIVQTGAVHGVGSRLISALPHEYPDNDGSRWAEPDIRQAARLMARMVQSPERYRPSPESLRRLEARFSSHAFVERASQRLAAIQAWRA